MKKNIEFLVGFIFILVLAACSNNSTSQDVNSDGNVESNIKAGDNSITIGITNPPGAFNPIILTDITAQYVSTLIYSPLVMQTPNLGFVNKLASSIETKDNKVFTITLHEKAVWSDGEVLDADDVIFTAKLVGNREIGANMPGINIVKGYGEDGFLEGDEPTGVVKIDNRTVQFILDEPIDQELFYSNIASNFKTIPEHIFRDVKPAEFNTSSYLQKPPVSSGPFIFEEHAANQYIALKANNAYFEGKPKIDELYFKIMTAANIVAQLQSGEIDMNWPGVGSIASSDFERVENLTNVVSEYSIPLDYNFLGINSSAITDNRVRQAIAMGIDREMIANNLLKGKAVISDSVYTPSGKYYNDKIETYQYNPEQAKKLLAEAGWNSNQVMKLQVPSGNVSREQAADLMVQNLASIGVKVQIEKFDVATVLSNARNDKSEMFILGYPYTHDPDFSMFYHTNGGVNVTHYSNPEMDRLLSEGLKEANPEKRKVIYDQVQEILHEELPMLVLYYDLKLLAKNERVLVGEPEPVGGFANVHEWEVK